MRDVPEPTPGPDDVLVEVHSVGVSFPDLLLSKGEYQLKPEPPFTLGVDFAGTVVVRADGFEPGQRVAGVGGYGGAAELVANPAMFTFALPDHVSFDEGAALPMNYLTAQFALAERGHLKVRRDRAGARRRRRRRHRDHPGRQGVRRPHHRRGQHAGEGRGREGRRRRRDGAARRVQGRGEGAAPAARASTSCSTSSAATRSPTRCAVLSTQGRLLVVGFASGQGIPEVKVNRLLLNNVDVRGVGWGAYAMVRPGYMQQQWAELLPMIASGVVKPPIGATYDLDEFGQALLDMDARKTLGKSVVRVRPA